MFWVWFVCVSICGSISLWFEKAMRSRLNLKIQQLEVELSSLLLLLYIWFVYVFSIYSLWLLSYYRFIFLLLTHIFKTLPLYFQNFTHKMQNASHLLQNEALHYKYHKHISKSNIFKHLSHNVTQRIVCCVLQKLSQRPKNSVWFCRFGVLLLFEVQLSETVWQVKTLRVSNKKNVFTDVIISVSLQ